MSFATLLMFGYLYLSWIFQIELGIFDVLLFLFLINVSAVNSRAEILEAIKSINEKEN